jgi:tripartite-type tricarboxylate transporter receptor subunit TctC
MVLKRTGQMLVSAAVLWSLHAPTELKAQTAVFPTQPIRLVVPYPPGGSSDPIARLVAQELSKSFTHPTVVENKAGGNTRIGAEFVARAAPDGHTLLLISGAITVNPSLYQKVGYDPIRDFTGVSLASWFPLVVHVHPSVPANSIAELISLAKAQPGKLSFASGGVGAANHLAGEMFNALAGVEILHIPYKGGAQALTDAIRGEFQLMYGSIMQSLPHVKAGRLKALAVSGPTRSPLAPELPTVAESGLPGYDVTSWNGFVVPTGTPTSVVSTLNREIVRILALPELQKLLAAQGSEALPTSPEKTQAFIVNEVNRWREIVLKAGIRIE